MSAPTHADKLKAAIEWLGTRWVLHDSRHVPQGEYELPIQKCDVRATFARERKRWTGKIEEPAK